MTIDVKAPCVEIEIARPEFSVSTERVIDYPAYSGEIYIIPSRQEQVLNTQGTRMTGNVTIAPIPSNWGLITQSGAGIRVS